MVVTWKGFYWTAAPPERLPLSVLPFPCSWHSWPLCQLWFSINALVQLASLVTDQELMWFFLILFKLAWFAEAVTEVLEMT